MVYPIIAILLFILSIVAAFLCFKLLANKKWIAGFLRGCAGILLLLATVFTGLSGKDLFNYKTATSDTNVVVTVSFRKKDANNYIVELQEPSGSFYSREVEGQQWQLTARAFSWPPLLAFVGLRSGYQLENISGRFIELQMDKMVGQKPSEPFRTDSLFDTWVFLNDYPYVLPFVTAHTAVLGFTPIADGAIYEVVSAGQNLSANPVNDVAKNAMKSW